VTKREIDKKAKRLVLEMQKNQYKSITTENAQKFCEENFVEIIKHLKYEGWIENNSNRGYVLTSKGYKFHPIKKYWGYLVVFALFIVGLVAFLNNGIDLFNKSKQLTIDDNKSISSTELVLNTRPLLFELEDLSLKKIKKDSIFIKSIGIGKIILDSIVLSKVSFTDEDYLFRDDKINLEPSVELITYHFEQKVLTESIDSDLVTMNLKFNMIPNIQPNNWFENNIINIATVTYKIYYTYEGRLVSKEFSNSVILELKEL
jgi:hypothetical protein